MLTLYVSALKLPIITADGSMMTVREVYVRESDSFRALRDCERFSELSGISMVKVGRYLARKIKLTPEIESAIVWFLQRFHAQQAVAVDCYAFANVVGGVTQHRAVDMLRFWETSPAPWRLRPGAIVFLTSGRNQFHHAAVYIGSRLFISVYGAGGDLEVSTLKEMRHDYGAEHVLIARPRASPST